MPLPPPRKPVPPPRDPDDSGESSSAPGEVLPKAKLPPPRKLPPPVSEQEPQDERRVLRPPPPPAMPRRRNFFGAFLGSVAVIVVIGGLFLWMLSENDGTPPPAQKEADRIRYEARMNPLPSTAREVSVLKPDESPDGNYAVLFTAPNADVDLWLKSSPGTEGVQPRAGEGGAMVYSIQPEKTEAAGTRTFRRPEIWWSRLENRVRIVVPVQVVLDKLKGER